MTKTDIIKAAFKVWGSSFYSNTSLSNVADELGVCKQAIYRHFLNKDALLEAMTCYFFDDFAEFIRPEYEKALNNQDKSESIFIFINIITRFFAKNVYKFIFSMINLYEHKSNNIDVTKELSLRGLNLKDFHTSISKNYNFEPAIMQLITTTVTSLTAKFHKERESFTKEPDEAEISKLICTISEIIKSGFGYTDMEINALDYKNLESRIIGKADNIADDPLLKAVAAAVAEAGPWEASMEQVAKRSGLSKSSLYYHFESKQDMLHRLFFNEFMRIIDFARQGIQQSSIPLEQLYLGIFSIMEYLCSKPDILVTLGWIRNRRLNFDPHGKKQEAPEIESMQIFDDIDIKHRIKLTEKNKTGISPLILILVVNTLMRKNKQAKESTEDIRFLFRFLTMGVKGFERK